MSKRQGLRILIFVIFGVFLWTEEILHANVCRVVSSSSASDDDNPPMVRGGAERASKQKQNSDAPLLVIHAGPGKTGTTTVQWAAIQQEELLQRDNIYYLGHEDKSKTGRDMHEFCRICQEEDMKTECADKWSFIQERLDHHYSQNHTVFLSEEMLSQFPTAEIEDENLWQYLDPILSKWRVRIIFTYRRYTDWFPSKYHQGFNPMGPLRTKAIRTNWPDAGGRIIQPFPIYFDGKFKKERFEYPHNVKRRWAVRFQEKGLSNVEFDVFNMHQDGDFLENFYCQVLPEANAMCKHLASDAAKDAVGLQNPSSKKTLHFDMLGVAAYRKGWVDKSLIRPEVADAVEAHAHELGYKTLMDFPNLHCLLQEQVDKMLAISIAYEHEMLPNSEETEKELRANFEKDFEKGKYCSVHVQETLQEQEWKSFFMKLDQAQVDHVQEDIKQQKRLERQQQQENADQDNNGEN